MADTPFFTLFTATFNRAHLLPRVYESLVRQSTRDFEWVIVDDGSTDDSGALVERWAREADFPVRYTYQENRGKHTAINRGVEMARGFMFVIVDSDDWLHPTALERIRALWESIPEAERDRYTGIAGLYAHPDGTVVGRPFPRDRMTSSSIDVRVRHKKRGDNYGVNRTEVLRRFPFPEDLGRFVAESLVWNRIARSYLQLQVNEVFAHTEYQSGGLSARSVQLRMQSPAAARLNYQEQLDDDLPLAYRLRTAANFVRFALHERLPPSDWARVAIRHPVVALGSPIGVVAHLADRWKSRSR